MRNAGLDEIQAGTQIAERNINNLRYADDTTLMAESEELKSLLMKVKEESEKVVLKLNIQCSLGVRPVYWGTFGVASRVPSSISNFMMKHGTLLRVCSRQRPHIAMNGEPRGF